MRKYELVCIIHPDLDSKAFAEVTEKIGNWVSEAGGTVEKTDVWGRRRMAYLIRKHREGQYVLFHVNMPPAAVASVEHNLRFNESVLRFLVTQVD